MSRVRFLISLFPQWYYKLAHQPCVLVKLRRNYKNLILLISAAMYLYYASKKVL